MDKSKNVFLLLFLLLVILTSIFIVLGSKVNTASIKHKASVVSERNDNYIISDITPQVKLSKIDSVSECRQLSNDISSHKAKKIKELRDKFDENADWDEFLIQGYSIEEIAYLIELVKPGLHAQRWVHDKRRTQSLAAQLKAKTDKEITEFIRSEFSEDEIESIRSAGFMLESLPRFPHKKLEDLHQFSKQEQVKIVKANNIKINDLDYFMGKSSVDDEIIGLMIEALSTEKDKVYYAGIRSINILDYALVNGRVDAYDLLVSKGYSPTDDVYLNNTLEWGLAGLSRIFERRQEPLDSNEKIKVKKIVSIVKKLNTTGFTVDFKENDRAFYSRGRGGFWDISQDSAIILRDYYGFDLRTLTQTPLVNSDSKKALLNLYETEILSDYEATSGILNFDDVNNNCDTKLNEIQALKNELNQNALEEVKRVVGLYNNDPVAIEKHLAALEPSLVDAYRASGPVRLSGRKRREFKFSNEDYGEKFFKTLHGGDYLKVTPLIQSASFLKEDHQVVFDYLCDNSYRIRWLDDFLDAGLKPDNFDACARDFVKMSASVVRKLSNLELNFKHKNHFGKGLLFRAVSSKKVDLISVLISENIVDSYTDDGSMTALDNILSLMAFNYSGAEFAKSDDYQILFSLLSKVDTIEESHKLRVSLIKKIHPDLYTELIDIFPSLEIEDTQNEPKYLFTYSGLFSRL